MRAENGSEEKISRLFFSADLAAIKKHDFVLTPGRYVVQK
jgi:hypothetical protein